GAGVPGLRAAIELAVAGRVLVLAKKESWHSSPPSASVGLTPALSDEDEVILHLQDTLIAGDGLSRMEAVKTLLEEAPERIQELMAWGKQLDRHGAKLVFESEASYSHSHVLRAPGNSMGSEVLRLLQAKVRTCKDISMLPFEFATELQREDQRVAGVSLISEKGLPEAVACSAVLLTTGGMGQLYSNTTNPEDATGDGVAMA